MRLDLNSTWVEIRKTPQPLPDSLMNVEFSLDPEDFYSLKQKLGFYYYRRNDNRFLLHTNNEALCSVVDPDGRVWRFVQSTPLNVSQTSDLFCKNL